MMRGILRHFRTAQTKGQLEPDGDEHIAATHVDPALFFAADVVEAHFWEGKSGPAAPYYL